MSAILPGGAIGILGGGQLGRMTAMAARSLGYRVQVLDPDAACPARWVADACVTAEFDDARAAAGLARACDVVTFEIEKVGLETLRAAEAFAPVRPGRELLALVQDKLVQKEWLAAQGFPVGPFRPARTEPELGPALDALGGRCFVKAAVGGYDGRGQVETRSAADAASAWKELGGAPALVERALELEAELSIMVARRPGGEVAVFPPALNHHEQRILAWSLLPAPLPPELLRRARELAEGLAGALGLEGLLAVELFLTRAGELFVNELAPRPHNTFHATERGCVTSQFEQHVRAVCDLPLGDPSLVRPAAIVNLLGEVWLAGKAAAFAQVLAIPGVRLHLYEKRVPKPGRKMGHLSALAETPEEAVRRVQEAGRLLGIAGEAWAGSLRG